MSTTWIRYLCRCINALFGLQFIDTVNYIIIVFDRSHVFYLNSTINMLTLPNPLWKNDMFDKQIGKRLFAFILCNVFLYLYTNMKSNNLLWCNLDVWNHGYILIKSSVKKQNNKIQTLQTQFWVYFVCWFKSGI